MKIRVKEYKDFDAFVNDPRRKEEELLAIVGRDNGGICADLQTKCARWQTAINRFFKALEGDARFDGWKEAIIESINSGMWADKETYFDKKCGFASVHGGWFWEVDDFGGSFYVVVNPGRIAG